MVPRLADWTERGPCVGWRIPAGTQTLNVTHSLHHYDAGVVCAVRKFPEGLQFWFYSNILAFFRGLCCLTVERLLTTQKVACSKFGRFASRYNSLGQAAHTHVRLSQAV